MGSVAFDPANFDFRRFGLPPLNVFMFAVLFPLFGLLVVPVVERVEQALAEPQASAALRALAALAALPVAMMPILAVGSIVEALRRGEVGGILLGLLLLSYLAIAVTTRWLVRRDQPEATLLAPVNPSRAIIVSSLLLAIPMCVGLALTVSGIAALLQ